MPQNLTKLQEARRRLVFEELLILQLGLITIKQKNLEENTGISFPSINEVDKFINNLPFELTSAQNRVFKEIQKDMDTNKQMNRLVQGDVGSGKTIVRSE